MLDAVIIGAGFAGLGAAIKLKRAGFEKIAVLEKADAPGGTWRDNQYPGAACDIPSLLYSYSFAPNPDWSRAYSPAPEINADIGTMIERYGLNDVIEYGAGVEALSYQDKTGSWLVQKSDGTTLAARAVISSAGPFVGGKFPAIEGLDLYQGHKIHSAEWDHGYDFKGKRVAVIGTGASAVQIVPELVKQASLVKVFQRTPGWVLPRLDMENPDWIKTAFRRSPALQKAAREALFWVHETMALGIVWTTPMTRLLETVARAYLRQTVKDKWLRRQLTPRYRIGCKRVLMTSDFYPALQKDNCHLITWPIVKLTEKGIRCAEGIEHTFDCIVFATGFDTPMTRLPFAVEGQHGRTLAQDWAGGAQAYRSVAVAGYPNLFFTLGPNSGPGHNSALYYMEAQLSYIVNALKAMREADVTAITVRHEAQEAFNEKLRMRLSNTNWASGCSSWYLAPDGSNPSMFPGFATQFRNQLKEFRWDDYERLGTAA